MAVGPAEAHFATGHSLGGAVVLHLVAWQHLRLRAVEARAVAFYRVDVFNPATSPLANTVPEAVGLHIHRVDGDWASVALESGQAQRVGWLRRGARCTRMRQRPRWLTRIPCSTSCPRRLRAALRVLDLRLGWRDLLIDMFIRRTTALQLHKPLGSKQSVP